MEYSSEFILCAIKAKIELLVDIIMNHYLPNLTRIIHWHRTLEMKPTWYIFYISELIQLGMIDLCKNFESDVNKLRMILRKEVLLRFRLDGIITRLRLRLGSVVANHFQLAQIISASI
jgi:hypothetical protein